MMKKLKRIISNNFYMVKYVVKYMPAYIFIQLFFVIYSDVIINYIYYNFLNNLYSQIESQITNSTSDFIPVLIQFAILISVQVVSFVLSSVLGYFYYQIKIPRFIEKMKDIIYHKSRTVEISKYENPDFYDDFVWSFEYASSMPFKVVRAIMEMLGVIASLVTIGVVIVSLDMSAAIFVAVLAIIGIVAKLLTAKAELKKDEDLVPVNRELDYVNRVLFLDTYAKELRMNKIRQLFLDKYDGFVDAQKKISLKNVKDVFWVNYTSSLLKDIVLNVVFYLYMSYQIVVTHTLAISGMMTILPAVQRTASDVRSFVFSVIDFATNSKYIEKFRAFMEYDPQIKDAPDALDITEPLTLLEMKNVWFGYDSSPEPVLKDVSLKIHKNEKIAIVGYNGAGKSTLIKLLLRLYEPNKGAIYLNGRPVRDYKTDDYRELFGTVFQDFKLFSVTIAENVKMDLLDGTPEEEERIKKALDAATFTNKLEQLPDGIYTQLGREFDDNGTILSGGEAQKVAIARTIMQNNQIVIMDEPSSALDPDSEYELNKLMMSATYNKAVVFISHRLSTTRMADKIYMLEDGRIIEHGSHDELMRLNGKYAEMFNLQAEKYLQE